MDQADQVPMEEQWVSHSPGVTGVPHNPLCGKKDSRTSTREARLGDGRSAVVATRLKEVKGWEWGMWELFVFECQLLAGRFNLFFWALKVPATPASLFYPKEGE